MNAASEGSTMPMTPSGPRRRIPFFARILAAMMLGVVVGLMFGPRAEPLGQLGNVIIGLIKTLAAPLLFFAVVDAFLRTQIRLRSGLIMLAITATNAALAVIIGLTLSNTLRPGDHLTVSSALSAQAKAESAVPEAKKIDFLRELTNYIPSSVVRPFLDNSIISIIFLALLSGIALRHVKNEQVAEGDHAYRVVEQLVATLYRAIEFMLGGVIAFVPLAVFGVVAKMIGQEGFAPLVGLAAYVGVAVLGLAIQVLVVYQAWIYFVSRRTLREFWVGARDAVVYALGASSSLASLPVTLRCLDRMKVSPQSARLAACVGTNLNNDGILLYEAMAVLFVAQVYGIELTLGQQLLTAASCVIAGVGIAAVPDAGLISLALVLATVGLPLELLPLLLTVDWLLSRCRAMTNVTSDILVAVLLDRFDREQSPPEEGADPELEVQAPIPVEATGSFPPRTA
ncbi:dicarboxylate/amino acid:cation (Na+ or H+) symporter, DAACS family [Singulisphaera sp. GP187]|uniref:dicarboxylate/amino acid:cation symporter n=1 Tax=Singulisphaera sp. GP187 TaxID=1882752 RepID=UPI000929F350|nr:dicarboxylate/amino acid:cation symporter [Singulisphaera sp. GP187]SIO64876.1 dicarboxylate/amino acid:cation (Na+ or H+) symporter, DAACS family [Singulisphaera sp. GP187]